MNWKFWKTSPEKKAFKDLKNMSFVFAYMRKMQDNGLLLWQERNRRLLIAQPLAVLMMKDEKTWRNFIDNCYLWQSYNLMLEAHNKALNNLESKAIREAKKKYAVLTKADTERIRRAVRDEYTGSGISAKINAFEFYVIADTTNPMPRTNEDDAQEKGGIVVVGSYDPDTEKLEIASWDEIKTFMP